jgi:hypothetical protein
MADESRLFRWRKATGSFQRECLAAHAREIASGGLECRVVFGNDAGKGTVAGKEEVEGSVRQALAHLLADYNDSLTIEEDLGAF